MMEGAFRSRALVLQSADALENADFQHSDGGHFGSDGDFFRVVERTALHRKFTRHYNRSFADRRVLAPRLANPRED